MVEERLRSFDLADLPAEVLGWLRDREQEMSHWLGGSVALVAHIARDGRFPPRRRLTRTDLTRSSEMPDLHRGRLEVRCLAHTNGTLAVGIGLYDSEGHQLQVLTDPSGAREVAQIILAAAEETERTAMALGSEARRQ